MPKLDLLSRVEQRTNKILGYFLVVIAPVASVLIADRLFLHDLSAFVRYPLWVVAAIVGFGICFGIAEIVGNGFDKLRKFLGQESMDQIERRIEKQRFMEEENRKQWFSNLTSDEKFGIIWKQQQEQTEWLKFIVKKLAGLVAWMMLLVLFVVVSIFK